jgi:hypothetical protein
MLGKFLIIIALLAIIYTLGSAFYFLIRDKGEGKRTVRRLGWRVGLSLLLLALMFFAMLVGWIQPGSSGPVRYPAPELESPSNP